MRRIPATAAACAATLLGVWHVVLAMPAAAHASAASVRPYQGEPGASWDEVYYVAAEGERNVVSASVEQVADARVWLVRGFEPLTFGSVEVPVEDDSAS